MPAGKTYRHGSESVKTRGFDFIKRNRLRLIHLDLMEFEKLASEEKRVTYRPLISSYTFDRHL